MQQGHNQFRSWHINSDAVDDDRRVLVQHYPGSKCVRRHCTSAYYATAARKVQRPVEFAKDGYEVIDRYTVKAYDGGYMPEAACVSASRSIISDIFTDQTL